MNSLSIINSLGNVTSPRHQRSRYHKGLTITFFAKDSRRASRNLTPQPHHNHNHTTLHRTITMKITAVVSLACRLVPTYTIAESSAGLRGRRAFSHSAPVRDSDRSIADPTYPDLHYHPNSSPPDTTTPYFALSFLSALPVSRTLLIGWTPARATNSAPILSPTTFFENEPFVELLHDVVRENVGEGDEPMKAAAEWQKEG
ncbi:hypothetical protein BC937DRAFT_86913 [Endogone sp. FLAS-F59071]|nr:hypothetical protein BC937DRAFT_86913 [Endogone sp. FLAS-F59071]|eukprot:RUS19788.1 hypothetical protein BC937DRAFT_86913 [Endogone sp. FLAS-F59071]